MSLILIIDDIAAMRDQYAYDLKRLGDSIEPLAGDAQAAEIHHLQRFDDLDVAFALRFKSNALALEIFVVRRRHAANGVPGAGLQQHGVAGLHRLGLKARHDRSARHGLLRKEIRGPHQ